MSASIIVTGAASGIGAALLHRLVAHGIEAVGIDREPGAHILQCDLADPDQIRRLAAALPQRVAGLANVAGIPGTAPAHAVLAVNVLAPRLLSELVGARILPGGAIVNVASIAAHRNTQSPQAIRSLIHVNSLDEVRRWLDEHPIEGPAAYDTSKRALVDWTAVLSNDLRGSGVRALSVSPGPIETPILTDFTATMGAESINASAAAVGRHGTADEIAAVVEFALSADAAWLNGVDIPVEGGLLATRKAAELTAQEVVG